ncbi:MAG TPA: hypothetical protein VF802_07200 [Candidatus Limnocylindrales bacterium]
MSRIRSAIVATALISLVLGTSPVSAAAASASGAAGGQATGGQAAGGQAAGGQADWAGVRAATAAFHDLSIAQAAGYGLFPGCFSDPTGGMGIHYVQFSSVADGVVDPLHPEALVYEPLAGGGLRLVAVEYVVIAASWTGATPPSVFGVPLTFVDSPNEFGLPPFYELHAWLWQPNPLGMFNEWNPMVSCAAAG